MAGPHVPAHRLRLTVQSVLLAVVLSMASAAALDVSRDDSVLGDLKLADDDDGPEEAVYRTFYGENVAPGDEVSGALRVIVEEPTHASASSRLDGPEVRVVTMKVVPNTHSAWTLLAPYLEVVELRYDGEDLLDDVAEACGAPVTMETLERCASRPGAPLDQLPVPTPEALFELTYRVSPELPNDFQGTFGDFTLRVTLELRASEDLADRGVAWGSSRATGSGFGGGGGSGAEAGTASQPTLVQKPSIGPSDLRASDPAGEPLGAWPPGWEALAGSTDDAAGLVASQEPGLEAELVRSLFQGLPHQDPEPPDQV